MFFNFTWLYWCSLMFTSVICCHMAHPLLFLPYFPFIIPLLSPTLPASHPLSLCLSVTPLFLFSPVSESHLPTLNQQAAEDCGNPWNRRDQGCRQGATATLECGASEKIRAVSPARERREVGEDAEAEWGGWDRNRESSKSVNGETETQRHKQPESKTEWDRERGAGDLGGHTLEMGSQPYSSLHFIYIPGRIDQSDWEQSPGLRRGIKRQNAFAALIPPW